MALDREGIAGKIEGYAAGVDGLIQQYLLDNGFAQEPPKVEVEFGPKYVRVWKIEPHSKSIHSFINRENGDILKPASWKGPLTKNGVRGNVFNINYGLGAVNHHGPKYLR